MELFKLFGSIFVDNEEANKSIKKTDDNASSLGEKFAKGATTVAKWGAAVGAAAVASATAIYKTVESSAKASDEIDKMSQRLGLSRQSYQELDYVLSQAGSDVNSFQTGMKSLLQNMDKVSEGNKTATANFNKLGIAVTNADGSLRAEEDVMWETISAFQHMEDSSEKSRLAQELFGKQGQELLPLLNSEAGSMEELRQQANDLGLVLSDETIDAGVLFTDTLDSAKRALEAVTVQVGTQVMPIVQKALEYILDHLPEIQSVVSKVFGVLQNVVSVTVNVIEKAGPIVVDLFEKWILPAVNKILDWVKSHGSEIKGVIEAIWNVVKGVAGWLYDTFWPVIESLWNSLLKPLIERIRSFIEEHGEGLKIVFTVLGETFKSIAEGIQFTITNVLIPIFEWLSKMVFEKIDDILGFFGGLLDFIEGIFTGNLDRAFEGLIAMISNWWDYLPDIFTAPFEWLWNTVLSVKDNVIDTFHNLVDAIGNIWQTIKDHFKLPHFRVEGSLNPIDWFSQGMPSIGVDWYAKAMNNGVILDEPTIFGFNHDGEPMGAGEVGPEAVVGVNSLNGMISQAVQIQTAGIEHSLAVLIDIVGEFLPDIAINSEKQIVIDGKVISKNTRDDISRSQNGQLRFKGAH